MQVIETISEMKAWRRNHASIGFVPTMGYLHEGHLSLVRLAKEKAEKVVVSIFINPLQFGHKEDLASYPRNLKRDLLLLEKEGVDCVFLPSTKEMYPEGFQTKVQVSALSQNLCGKKRPGHFEGVATVVLKHFQIVNPAVSVFGEKDFQQLRVIEQMVEDLHLDTKIIRSSIMREPDGLAMSSRNKYLTPAQRERASILFQSLNHAKARVKAGEIRAIKIIKEAQKLIESVHPTKIDYIQICDAKSLQDVLEVKEDSRLFLAVYFGNARLIDNMSLKEHGC